MDNDRYVNVLEGYGAAMADAAELAGLDAKVPPCPEWDVRALLDHTGMVHRWATAQLRGERDAPFENAPDLGVDLWFRQGLETLVGTLRETAPDAPAFGFLAGAPQTASFWARRMAHETTVHGNDAVAALGFNQSIESDLALDGIGELLEGFFGRKGGRLVSDPPFSLRVAPTDADVSWLVTVHPDRREIVRDGAGEADATFTGESADLYLRLWNRTPSGGVQVSGDRTVSTRWSELARITWS